MSRTELFSEEGNNHNNDGHHIRLIEKDSITISSIEYTCYEDTLDTLTTSSVLKCLVRVFDL